MSVDFYWTADDDLAIGPNGDIRDSSFDIFRSLWQEVRTRCKANSKDWALHPNLAANLEELIGNVNNRMTAEEGKTRIISVLVQGGFLPKDVIRVRYLPISRHQLLYDITITVIDPGTGRTRMLKTQLLYDSKEGSMVL